MLSFIIHFLLSNVILTIALTGLIGFKYLMRRHLSARIQYNLWFPMLALFAVPFVPVELPDSNPLLSWFTHADSNIVSGSDLIGQNANKPFLDTTTNWMNDFCVSVRHQTPSHLSIAVLAFWILGIGVMSFLAFRSIRQFDRLKQSALTLQNQEVSRLYQQCCRILNVKRNIPIYSTAFLKSPITTGFWHPRIYLPIHLISDYHEKEMKYMLMHELQHYKHMDAIVNHMTNLLSILYWFNPAVWFAIHQMRVEREIACDSSVLKRLDQNDYQEYGTTLIHLAEKMSRSSFTYASGMVGNLPQLKRRILNIASYEPETLHKRLRNAAIYSLITALLLSLAPALTIRGADSLTYHFQPEDEIITKLNLEKYFGGYEGSFVLYDTAAKQWSIYHQDDAVKRISPCSTFKIYSALSGLDSNVITSSDSHLAWNGPVYPIALWNADQNLSSAMENSVNWYFQQIDEQIGAKRIKQYLHNLNYGNETMSDQLSTYWMDSSLKISPVEQVLLLRKLFSGQLSYSKETMDTVKDTILLSSYHGDSLYGKTGTGRMNGQNVNGWFIGMVETEDTQYYFATNLQADQDASGSNAAKLTFQLLSDLTACPKELTNMIY